MNKEQAVTYLRFSGFSDEQIKAIEGAFACPSAGVDCEDCPAYKPKSNINEVLDNVRAEMDGLLNDEDSNMYAHGVMDCLEIIDKYKAESEERKNDTDR